MSRSNGTPGTTARSWTAGEAIRHSSELLYQVTNGQAALGDVRIFQNKERWNTADIVMYADNGVRPSATIGGIVTQPISDTIKAGAVDNVFIPGQVRVGPNWDPFGESREELSQDWWRALAHDTGTTSCSCPITTWD